MRWMTGLRSAAFAVSPAPTAFVRFRRDLADSRLFDGMTRQLHERHVSVKQGTLVEAHRFGQQGRQRRALDQAQAQEGGAW